VGNIGGLFNILKEAEMKINSWARRKLGLLARLPQGFDRFSALSLAISPEG